MGEILSDAGVISPRMEKFFENIVKLGSKYGPTQKTPYLASYCFSPTIVVIFM